MWLAKYCNTNWKNKVQVIRPPMCLYVLPEITFKYELTDRYLVYFGEISYRKGIDILYKALLKVFRKEPDFKMLWIGKINNQDIESKNALENCLNYSKNFLYLGHMKKEHLHYIVQKSVASVLPSRVDNLPNTAMESLLLGIPVIGSKGSSIEELVEPGYNGELFSNGNIDKLSEIMIRVWRNEYPWLSVGFTKPKILLENTPKRAAENLLKLASVF